MILLAVIGSAYGIQGAVKVKTFTQAPKNIFDYGPLLDERRQTYVVHFVRTLSKDNLILAIEGITNRTQAEALHGTKLFVDREQFPDLPEEEFYQSDLIGLLVQSLEGHDVGHIRAFGNYGAGDFLEILGIDGHIYTIPFTHEAVPVIRLPSNSVHGMVQINHHYLLGSAIH